MKQAKILEAEGEAQAIQLVNESAERYFTAQILHRLINVERSLAINATIVVPDVGGVPLFRSRIRDA